MKTRIFGFPGKKASVNLVFILMDIIKNHTIPTQAFDFLQTKKFLKGRELLKWIWF